jgi:hypothetical protein
VESLLLVEEALVHAPELRGVGLDRQVQPKDIAQVVSFAAGSADVILM